MRPTSVTLSADGNSSAIVVDIYSRAPVTLQVDITGTITAKVQQTLDNVFDIASGSVQWTDHPDPNLSSITADVVGGSPYPPFAYRLVASGTAGGTAKLTVISGSSNG